MAEQQQAELADLRRQYKAELFEACQQLQQAQALPVAAAAAAPPPADQPEITALEFPAVDFVGMASLQIASDAEDNSLKVVRVPWGNTELLCDVSTGTRRPLVPPTFRRRIFQALHGLSHPGPKSSTSLITSRFVWPGIKKDIRQWCQECHLSLIHI